MARKLLTIEQTLTLLAATPERFATLSAGLAPAQLRMRPSPDEWSATEVLAHLRACADVRGSALLTILDGETRTLRAFNPLTWIEQTDYRDLDFAASLQAFTAQRATLLATLRALEPEGWARSVIVTGAGKPLTRDARHYAQWLAIHERPHVKQMARICATLRD